MYNYLLLLLLLALVVLIFFGVWESRTREIRKMEAEEEIEKLNAREDRLFSQMEVTKSEHGKRMISMEIRETRRKIADVYRSIM